MPRFVPLYYWDGQCHTLKRWSQILDIPLSVLYYRVGRNKPFDEIFKPVLEPHNLSYLPIRAKMKRLRRVIRDRRDLGLDTIHLEIYLHHTRSALR